MIHKNLAYDFPGWLPQRRLREWTDLRRSTLVTASVREGNRPMDPATAASIATAANATASFWMIQAWRRVQQDRAREASRRAHVRDLPPGSRIRDLGSRGILIEIGTGGEGGSGGPR